jgi:hypothetical protein
VCLPVIADVYPLVDEASGDQQAMAVLGQEIVQGAAAGVCPPESHEVVHSHVLELDTLLRHAKGGGGAGLKLSGVGGGNASQQSKRALRKLFGPIWAWQQGKGNDVGGSGVAGVGGGAAAATSLMAGAAAAAISDKENAHVVQMSKKAVARAQVEQLRAAGLVEDEFTGAAGLFGPE